MAEALLAFGAVMCGVFVLTFGGYSIGSIEAETSANKRACTNYGTLLHVETQYRDGDCQLRRGDGWVWLEDELKGAK